MGRLFFCFGFIFLIGVSVMGQEKKDQMKKYQEQLNETRREIAKLRSKIEKQTQKERSSLSQLEQIDQERHLIQKLLRQLKLQEAMLRKNISQTNEQVIELQKRLKEQQRVYAGRLVHFYKQRHFGDLEILLKAKSLNQAIKYLTYRKKIAETDQRRLKNLLETRLEIEKTNQKKQQQLDRIQALEKEKEKEERVLANRRRQKESILAEIRSKKDAYEEQIKDWEQAQNELLRLIRSREFDRKSLSIDLAKPSEFPKLRGKMIWPVKGKIIHEFGLSKHPITKIPYRYEGVDIQAKYGTKVKATCSGVVTMITWQRTRGNVVIINHYGGYYTVYTHLSEIHVTMGQEVKTGQVIGLVGDSGSLSGPKLHFQVWQKTKAVNPRIWLSRRPS